MNTKMKVLSLALVGAFGYVGAASAACPSSAVPPWTDVVAFQGTTTIATPGMAGTECKLNAAINAGANAFASAQVHDATPNAEPRYRAQFLINTDALAAPGFADVAQIFSATSAAYPLQLTMFGNGTGWFLGYNLGSSVSGSVPLAAGENVVEFDLQIGATGSLTFWVNNNSEASPTVPAIATDNSAMVGIDDAYLGLGAPTPSFVNKFGGVAVGFDQFDSRRQTFIGF
jgi:hypothetical protein